jgi:hypothetical protein
MSNPYGADFSTKLGDGVATADGFSSKGQNYVKDSAGLDTAVLPVYSSISTVSLAQLNAGLTLIPNISGRTIKIVEFLMIFNGTFTTATDIRLQDTNGAPVNIATVLIANASAAQNAASDVVGTGVTNGAGCFANLTASKGVAIVKTGSAAAGGISIMVRLKYNVI